MSNSLVPPLTRTQKAIYVEDEDCWIVEEKSAEELIAHGFFLSEEDADSYYIQKHKTERSARFDSYRDELERLQRLKRQVERTGGDTSTIDADLATWDVYGQALADITDQPGWPREVQWPVRPFSQ